MYTNGANSYLYSATPGHCIQMSRSPYSSFAITPIPQTQQTQGYNMGVSPNTQTQTPQTQYSGYQTSGGQAYAGSQTPPSQY